MYQFNQGIIGSTGKVAEDAVAIHSACHSMHPDVPVRSILDGLGFGISAFAPKLNVSPAMAVRLSATIGDTAKSRMLRQAEYDLKTACNKLISTQSRTGGDSS